MSAYRGDTPATYHEVGITDVMFHYTAAEYDDTSVFSIHRL